MKNAVEGIYNEGKVILSENINFKGKTKVLVVFLEDVDQNKSKRERLISTFDGATTEHPILLRKGLI
jgi:hypothetical protein